MVELLANSGDPDQTPRSAASDPGLHSLSATRSGDFSLQLVKESLDTTDWKAIVRLCGCER